MRLYKEEVAEALKTLRSEVVKLTTMPEPEEYNKIKNDLESIYDREVVTIALDIVQGEQVDAEDVIYILSDNYYKRGTEPQCALECLTDMAYKLRKFRTKT